MNRRSVARAASISALALLGGAGASVLVSTTVFAPRAVAEAPPVVRRSNLADLTNLRVVLVLRADWLSTSVAGVPANPAANALGRASALLYCRIDQVHQDWLEVSAPRIQGDAGGQVNTTRDVWLIRNDAVVAVQTAEADR